MSPEISKHVFKEAVECGLLQHGPDACGGAANAVREISSTTMRLRMASIEMGEESDAR